MYNLKMVVQITRIFTLINVSLGEINYVIYCLKCDGATSSIVYFDIVYNT